MSSLPGILAQIEAAAGQAVALKLARERGGTEVQISARAGSAFVELVGQVAATKIAKAVGAGKATIPMATARGARARRANAARMLANGATETQTALACDIHARTARRIRAKVAADPSAAQPGLFDD